MEPRLRASPKQFSVLVDFMERHGDLSRRESGPQGRIKGDRLWQELTIMLNSLGGGVQKSTEKWKKAWADLKTKTKKKYLSLRLQARGTGGGPSSRISLTALEERVVAIIGVSAVLGQAGIQEQGFNQTSNEQPIFGVVVEPAGSAFPLEGGNALDIVLEDHSQKIAVSTPASRVPQTQQMTPHVNVDTMTDTPAAPPSPPPPTPPPVRTSPRNRRQASASPRSTATTPRRALLRARRNRGLTPFERASERFAAVEQRRLELEEARGRRSHELEMERLRLEAERIEVAREHNVLLHQLSLLGQRLIDVITQQRPVDPVTTPTTTSN